jgi:hypothetical protein
MDQRDHEKDPISNRLQQNDLACRRRGWLHLNGLVRASGYATDCVHIDDRLASAKCRLDVGSGVRDQQDIQLFRKSMVPEKASGLWRVPSRGHLGSRQTAAAAQLNIVPEVPKSHRRGSKK